MPARARGIKSKELGVGRARSKSIQVAAGADEKAVFHHGRRGHDILLEVITGYDIQVISSFKDHHHALL